MITPEVRRGLGSLCDTLNEVEGVFKEVLVESSASWALRAAPSLFSSQGETVE